MIAELTIGIVAALALLFTAIGLGARRSKRDDGPSFGEAMLSLALGPLGVVCMADTSLVIPSNTFYGSAGGLSPKTCTKKVKTATGIRKGGYVELDTTDEEVKKATEDSQVAIGIVISNVTDKTWDGDDDPTAGDVLEILLIGSGEVGITYAETDLSLGLGKGVAVNANGFAKAVQTDTVAHLNAKVGKILVGADGSVAKAKIAVVM